MTVKRRRIRQIALRRENIESTAEALVAADTLGIAIFDPSFSYDIPAFERNPAQATLSKLSTISGARTGTITFQTDFKGSGALNTAPAVGQLLECSGFAKLYRRQITISSVVGTFVVGELVTASPSGAILRVLKSATTGATTLVYTPVTGVVTAADTLLGGTSGATADSDSTFTAVGFAYEPQSKSARAIPIGAITGGPFLAGERITGSTSGAIGRVINDTATGLTRLYYVAQGTIAFTSGEVITGGISGATATSTAVSNCALPTGSFTLFSNEDTIRKPIKGARGKVKLTFGKVGEPGRLEFEIMGVPTSAPFDSVMFPDIGDSLNPPKFQGATFSVGGYSPIISTHEVMVDNTMAARLDATDPSGHISVLIVDRKVNASMDPEMVDIAVNDYHTHWFNDTLKTYQAIIGSVAGNIVEITGPNVQYSNLTDENRDEIAALGAEFNFVKGTFGDDEILFQFY